MPTIWKVEQLDYTVDAQGDPVEITTAHWRATDGEGELIGTSYGTVGFTPEHAINQVPFANLQEVTVIGYVKAEIGGEQVSEIESNNAAQVAEKTNPTKGGGPPPWAV